MYKSEQFTGQNYLYVQSYWMKVIGVWPKSMNIPWLPKALYRPFALFYKLLINCSLMHMTLLFYKEFTSSLGVGTFDEITDALTQSIIYSFASFSYLYFQIREDTYYRVTNYVNNNFKFRSAKGTPFIYFI